MTIRPGIFILGAPIESEALLEGVNLMPGALRDAGLAEALGADDLGDLDITVTDTARDPETGVIAFTQIVHASELLRDSLLPLLDRPQLPLVVGGCCGVLPGIFAALQRRFGRVGLAFVDGHYDFYDAASSPSGALADMELGVLTGYGPSALTDLGGPPPLLEPRDAWVLGYRDATEMAERGAPDPPAVIPAAHFVDAERLKRRGASAVGGEAATALAGDPGRFWLHVDLDVLDQEVMAAVDYLLPGGLDWHELAALLQPLAASPGLVGLDVTIYNPSLDPRRRYPPLIVGLLAGLLAP